MLYSDRENGTRPRIIEEISITVWGGIYSEIQLYLDDGSLGERFPLECPDRQGIIGSNNDNVKRYIKAQIPELEWPLTPDTPPSLLNMFDLIEIIHEIIAKPIKGDYHSYWGHHHLME